MDHSHMGGMDMGGATAPDMGAHMAGMKMYVHGGIGDDSEFEIEPAGCWRRVMVCL